MRSSFIILLVIVLLSMNSFTLLAQGGASEPQYLSEVLASTVKKKATYYRVNEGKEGERYIGKTYTLAGKLKVEGHYADPALEIEHGAFVYYHDNGRMESKGEYVKGHKSGVWSRYDGMGNPLAEKIYDPEPLANIVYSRAQTMPQYAQGGDRAFVKYIKEKASPSDGKRLKGTVTTSFIVEKNGELTDVKVIEGKGEPLDGRVVDAVRSTSPWQPGADKGQPVRVKVNVPVQF